MTTAKRDLPTGPAISSPTEHGWYHADSIDGRQKNVPMYFDGYLSSSDQRYGSRWVYMPEAWHNFRRLAPAHKAAPDLAAVTGELDRLQLAVHELEESTSEAESRANECGNRIADLRSQLTAVQRERDALRADCERLNALVRETGMGQGEIDTRCAEGEAKQSAPVHQRDDHNVALCPVCSPLPATTVRCFRSKGSHVPRIWVYPESGSLLLFIQEKVIRTPCMEPDLVARLHTEIPFPVALAELQATWPEGAERLRKLGEENPQSTQGEPDGKQSHDVSTIAAVPNLQPANEGCSRGVPVHCVSEAVAHSAVDAASVATAATAEKVTPDPAMEAASIAAHRVGDSQTSAEFIAELKAEVQVKPGIQLGDDGRCRCNCAMPCPLGRTGAEYRCTAAELQAAGVSVEYPARADDQPAESEDDSPAAVSERTLPAKYRHLREASEACHDCGHLWKSGEHYSCHKRMQARIRDLEAQLTERQPKWITYTGQELEPGVWACKSKRENLWMLYLVPIWKSAMPTGRRYCRIGPVPAAEVEGQ